MFEMYAGLLERLHKCEYLDSDTKLHFYILQNSAVLRSWASIYL